MRVYNILSVCCKRRVWSVVYGRHDGAQRVNTKSLVFGKRQKRLVLLSSVSPKLPLLNFNSYFFPYNREQKINEHFFANTRKHAVLMCACRRNVSAAAVPTFTFAKFRTNTIFSDIRTLIFVHGCEKKVYIIVSAMSLLLEDSYLWRSATGKI